MSKIFCSAAILIILCLYSGTSGANDADLIATDIAMVGISLTGIAHAYFTDDREGEKQWLRNTIANQLLTSVARVGFNYTSWGERPDGSGYGFPSGHVAFAGSGASFLQERYGWKYGVPAYMLTGYLAYVRVEHGIHHPRDVVVAALLAYGVGKLFVTPVDATHLAPVIGPDFMGLRWQRSW